MATSFDLILGMILAKNLYKSTGQPKRQFGRLVKHEVYGIVDAFILV